MKSKKVFTILCIAILVFLTWKSVYGIIFLVPREEYTKDIIPLGIGLFLIGILGGIFRQKNWRLGCLTIGISSILIYIGMISIHELRKFIYFSNMIVILIGFINFNHFYKSDFEPQLKSKARQPIYDLILPLLFILLILLIFLIFGRNL